jgi:hypothetical protein
MTPTQRTMIETYPKGKADYRNAASRSLVRPLVFQATDKAEFSFTEFDDLFICESVFGKILDEPDDADVGWNISSNSVDSVNRRSEWMIRVEGVML